MKKTLIIPAAAAFRTFCCCCCICIFFCISCNDRDNAQSPGLLSGVKATGLHGEIALEWTIPDTVAFLYVDIAYTASNGEPRNRKVSAFARQPGTLVVRDTVTGFADTREYTFSLTPWSKYGAPAQSATVKATPLTAPFVEVLNSVEITPDFGGAIVTWENKTGRPVNLLVTYLDNDGQSTTKMFATLSAKKGDISSLNGGEKKYSWRTEDAAGNRSEIKEAVREVYAETKFDRARWTFPGYNENSQDETIGYSSQATNEGASPNGRVKAIIDGELNTFWHARWSSPSSSYPHWYIVDLGSEVTVSRIEMTGRHNNTSGQTGQRFLTCTAAGTDYPANSVNPSWEWIDQGSYAYGQTSDVAKKTQSYRLSENPKARYIKVLFDAEHKGSGVYAMVGEMSVFGQE
jgi:hypothetical protein